jgi:hypothetical protein
VNAFIDRKYIDLISYRFPDFTWKSGNLANCRCPFCGDSKHKKAKKRGYFYLEDGKWYYFCHNACGRYTMKSILYRIDMRLYHEYVLERGTDITPVDAEPPPKKDIKAFDDPYAANLAELRRLDQIGSEHPAWRYAKHRKIDDFNFLWCPEFMKWTNGMIPEKFDDKALLFDEGRIVIPYFTADHKFFAFLGRSIETDVKNGLRYILIILNNDIPLIYGLDRFDPTRSQKYAVEGPLDSRFLPNCIALSGSNMGDLTYVPSHDRLTIIFDNEPHSKDTKKKISHAIDLGYDVCIWPKWIDYKDINQMVMAGWSQDYITNVIDTNTYSDMAARIKLQDWSLK